jgi:hypothetical protein
MSTYKLSPEIKININGQILHLIPKLPVVSTPSITHTHIYIYIHNVHTRAQYMNYITYMQIQSGDILSSLGSFLLKF